jgi:hypothetical protein
LRTAQSKKWKRLMVSKREDEKQQKLCVEADSGSDRGPWRGLVNGEHGK